MTRAYESDEEVWRRFTGRPGRALPLASAEEAVEGKRILITGAGGSIGSALARAVVGLGVRELVLLDVAETGLHELSCDERFLSAGVPARFAIGSIGDEALLGEIFGRHRPQIVFHAAACKHVPLMEANPFTAAATNALGTERVVRASAEFGAEVCVLLSTDKAVEPSSVMGATKRIAELIVLGERGSTRFKAVRLGNVLGSSGSVGPMFQQQIRRGGPVTVTHAEATRYFLPVSEAVESLVGAVDEKVPGGVLLPEMGEQHRILDLAKFLIGWELGRSEAVKIVFTGLRPGDKVTERLIAGDEILSAEVRNGLRQVENAGASALPLESCLGEIREAVEGRDLRRLLTAIVSVVPGFEPSDVLKREGMTLAQSVPA